jgi:hypothetical protein
MILKVGNKDIIKKLQLQYLQHELTKTYNDLCINCNNNKAEIYQVNGDYCLEC